MTMWKKNPATEILCIKTAAKKNTKQTLQGNFTDQR